MKCSLFISYVMYAAKRFSLVTWYLITCIIFVPQNRCLVFKKKTPTIYFLEHFQGEHVYLNSLFSKNIHVHVYICTYFLNVRGNGDRFVLISHKWYMNSIWQNYRIVIHFNRCAHMQKILMFVYLFLHVQQFTCFCT